MRNSTLPRELALATEEEIASALGKQGVTNIKRISIRKGEERIQTNTYILTYNQPHTPKEVKISQLSWESWAVRPSSPEVLQMSKIWTRREACRGRQTCAKCSEKDLDHLEEDCLKQIRCANCQQDHIAYIRSCDVYKKEKELLEVKCKRNVSFQEARKIIGTDMEKNKYVSVARRAATTN